jgi:hypothetical protein
MSCATCILGAKKGIDFLREEGRCKVASCKDLLMKMKSWEVGAEGVGLRSVIEL